MAVALIALGVLVFNGCAPTVTPSISQPRSRYVKNKHQPTVIVFVHGFDGDATITWTNPHTMAYFPDLVTEDPAFRDVDVFVYEYATSFTRDTFRIKELAENMRLVLNAKEVLKRTKIIFVAHSMGGLVTRAFLLKYRELAERVPFVYFFATPTTGVEIARIGSIVSPSRQVAEMAPADLSLADFQNDWLAAGFQILTYCAYELRSTFGRRIVTEQSAMMLCNRPGAPIDANHQDIVKPTGPEDAPYIAILSAFRDAEARKGGQAVALEENLVTQRIPAREAGTTINARGGYGDPSDYGSYGYTGGTYGGVARRLTDMQRSVLVGRLLELPKVRVVSVLRWSSGPEVEVVSDEFKELFKQVGWPVVNHLVSAVPTRTTGLTIFIRSQEEHPPAADVLILSLREFGFKVEAGLDAGLGLDEIKVSISPDR